MRRIKIKKGSTWVVLTGALAGDLEDELMAALGGLGEAIQDESRSLMTSAKSRWPVDTGESRDSLGVTVTVQPTRMRVSSSVTTTSRYARYIMWGAKRLIWRGHHTRGPRGEPVVARGTDTSGREITIFGPKNPRPRGGTTGRGGVRRDLLTSPAKDARKRIRAKLPSLILARMKAAGLVV